MQSRGGSRARETDAEVDVWFLGLVPGDRQAELRDLWELETVAVTVHCKALPVSFRM